VYGGMALVCSNRLGPGRIDHSYAGLLSGGVGASSATITAEENKKAYESLWEPVNVDIAYEPSILGGRWRKVYTFA
jgi:ketopantoate reductase